MFPLVASRIVFSGFSLPSRSASRIMLRPGRSFTEPPGFRNSSLNQISIPGRSRVTRFNRISGVFPIWSSSPSGCLLGTPENGGVWATSDCFQRVEEAIGKSKAY